MVVSAPPAEGADAPPLRAPRWRRYPPVESPLSLATIASASGRVIRSAHGARERLRTRLMQRFDADEAILCASGTDALTGALRIACADRTRLIALPAFACFDLATAAVGADTRIVFYDVDPETLQPDWPSFDATLEHNPAAVVVAPLFGYPIDWTFVERSARARDVMIIEDAAQAAGAVWQGRPVGSFGDLTVLSFGRGKGWTGAGGGALLVRHSVRASPTTARAVDSETRLRADPPGAGTRAAVAALAQWTLAHPRVYRIPASLPFLHLGMTRYREPSPPSGMSAFSAALADANADATPLAAERRAARAREYDETLHSHSRLRVPSTDVGGTAGHLRYPVILPDPTTRNRALDALQPYGAAASYPAPLPQLEALRVRVHGTGVTPPGSIAATFPGALVLTRQLLTLPLYPTSDPSIASRLARFVTQSNCSQLRK